MAAKRRLSTERSLSGYIGFSGKPVVFLYILVDPRDDQVRYVGKSIRPARRLRAKFGFVPHDLSIKQPGIPGYKVFVVCDDS
jgi:hypothetical protein